jgi:hypothetical protein
MAAKTKKEFLESKEPLLFWEYDLACEAWDAATEAARVQKSAHHKQSTSCACTRDSNGNLTSICAACSQLNVD